MLLLLLLTGAEVSCDPLVSPVSKGLLNQLGISIHSKEVVSFVRGVEGSGVQLPCNISSTEAGDSVQLVLWFKGDGDRPIYTFDTRGGLRFEDARHYSDDNIFKGRAYFRGGDGKGIGGEPRGEQQDRGFLGSVTMAEPQNGRLIIEGVHRSDQGLYRCRTDFKIAPTRMSSVQLGITVPPEKPVIYDEFNKPVQHKLGPYREGEVVDLNCEVVGGDPVPDVTWWRDHTLLDTNQQILNHKVVSRLRISEMTRKDLHSIYTCQASNTNASAPVSTSVKLDLTYGPESVEIVGMKPAMLAGLQYKIRCIAQGSRPVPTIQWFRDQQNIDAQVLDTQTSTDGIQTTSTLMFTPSLEDDGSRLRCEAGLSNLPETNLETSWNIIVHYIPRVSLEYGKSLQPTNVKEDQDVYFECSVFSNPPPVQIIWKKNGVALVQNIRSGIIILNQTLVLQKVSRQSAGAYSCQARNSEGRGASNSLDLNVRFAPECRTDLPRVYGAAKHQIIKVQCSVDSPPGSEVRFYWRLNTTTGIIDIQESAVTTEGHTSWLQFNPRSELDYGVLLCTAENSVGRQSVPCAFTLRPEAAPAPVGNCSVLNQSVISLNLQCETGFNSGMRQQFQLEVFDFENQVVANITSAKPNFSLTGLKPGSQYSLSVYSFSSQGASERFSINAMTPPLKQPDRRITDQAKLGSLKTKFTMTPVLGVLIGVGASILLVCFAIFAIICCRAKHEKSGRWSRKGLRKPSLTPDIIPQGEEEYTQLCGGKELTAKNKMYIQDTFYNQNSRSKGQAYHQDLLYANSQELDIIHYNISTLNRRDGGVSKDQLSYQQNPILQSTSEQPVRWRESSCTSSSRNGNSSSSRTGGGGSYDFRSGSLTTTLGSSETPLTGDSSSSRAGDSPSTLLSEDQVSMQSGLGSNIDDLRVPFIHPGLTGRPRESSRICHAEENRRHINHSQSSQRLLNPQERPGRLVNPLEKPRRTMNPVEESRRAIDHDARILNHARETPVIDVSRPEPTHAQDHQESSYRPSLLTNEITETKNGSSHVLNCNRESAV